MNSIIYRDLPEVVPGVMLNLNPDFIAPSTARHSVKPGFYLRDSNSGERFTAYLEQLNSKDVSMDEEYRMIVRGIGESGGHIGGSTLARLEQRLSIGDKIHVRVEERTRRGVDYISRFLKYRVFIPPKFEKEGESVGVPLGDYIFGRVLEIRDNLTTVHFSAILQPISVVSESRFNLHRNRIYSEED